MKRFRSILLVVLVAVGMWFVAGITSAQVACAHDPRFACSPRSADRAVQIPDPSKSWAYYGRLLAGASDTYRFTVEQQLRVPMSLLIEVPDASNPARPSIALTDERGKTVAVWDFTRSERFHEPFSGLDYLTTPQRNEVLAPGTYAATVTMHGGTLPQRYVFAIGEAEKFGVGEIPYVLGAVYRVKTRGY